MKSFAQSMYSAMTEILPHYNVKEITDNDIQGLNIRISMINHLLIAVLDGVNKDPYFWKNVDRALFAKTMADNKQAISQMRAFVQPESHMLALLDNVQSNIAKLEKSLAEYPMFNFDLERMKDRVNDVFHEVPKSVKTVDDFRHWLKGVANEH